MSWRREDVWLDADLLWFGERAGGAAVAGFAPAPIPGPAVPPGLAASLRRRTEWKRRRAARRGWATLLALAPAVMLPLGPLRGGQEAKAVAEDPPGLAYWIEPAGDPRPGRESTGVPGGASPAAEPQRNAAPADAPPKIEWRRATSVGLPYAGSLVDGTRLPVEAPNWVTWNPITDSVPNAPWRLYGHERTIRAIVSVAGAYRSANPGAPRVVVGDISREGGGPMTDVHVSHQNGLDVDVYYPRRDGAPKAPGGPQEIDLRLAQDLVDRFVAAGAQLVLIGHSTGLHGPAGVVVPYANHENHMHVRFSPPFG
jgi:hypothetical protein